MMSKNEAFRQLLENSLVQYLHEEGVEHSFLQYVVAKNPSWFNLDNVNEALDNHKIVIEFMQQDDELSYIEDKYIKEKFIEDPSQALRADAEFYYQQLVRLEMEYFAHNKTEEPFFLMYLMKKYPDLFNSKDHEKSIYYLNFAVAFIQSDPNVLQHLVDAYKQREIEYYEHPLNADYEFIKSRPQIVKPIAKHSTPGETDAAASVVKPKDERKSKSDARKKIRKYIAEQSSSDETNKPQTSSASMPNYEFTLPPVQTGPIKFTATPPVVIDAEVVKGLLSIIKVNTLSSQGPAPVDSSSRQTKRRKV